MDRIILHWTAGTHAVNALDREHYHYIIDGSGIVCEGDHAVETNLNCRVSGTYAAHTSNCNTGSIGVSMAGMMGAVERPFSAGSQPLTLAQVEAAVQLIANLCRQYAIPVTRATVLSHAEVQPTLGVTQSGKWDVTHLPGMDAPGDAIEVGDVLRARILAAIGQGAPVAVARPLIRKGAKGEHVRALQTALRSAGFGPAKVDGDFGSLTEDSVRRFQTAKGLTSDGIVGPQTWAKLNLKG